MTTKNESDKEARHEIIIRFKPGENPYMEFNEVTVVELLAAIPFIEIECRKLLYRIEVEAAQSGNGSGIVPVAAIPDSLRGRN
jgi:hypothetical protein